MIRVKKKNKKTLKAKAKKVLLKKKAKKVVKKKSKKKTVKKTVKKKITKKKVSKKKVVKKKTSKKKTVKRKKYKRRKKILMEDIYAIINKAQIGKKKIVFVSEIIDACTIENTIKDAELEYDKIDMKTQVAFTLYPNEYSFDEEDVLKLEIMDDEIPEIGQIFG